MKQPTYRPAPGFTLIEMLTVVFIIVVLAGLGVAGLGFVNERQNKAKAQVDIALISKAIEDYYSDNGQYPGMGLENDEHTASDNYVSGKHTGLASKDLYDKLFLQGYQYTKDSGASSSEWDGKSTQIYLVQLDPMDSKQTLLNIGKSERSRLIQNNDPGQELYEIVDPWKRPYLYRIGLDAQNPDFDLWSSGKDGLTDYNNPERSIEVNADDIRNF